MTTVEQLFAVGTQAVKSFTTHVLTLGQPEKSIKGCSQARRRADPDYMSRERLCLRLRALAATSPNNFV